jgi:hypothetical protein
MLYVANIEKLGTGLAEGTKLQTPVPLDTAYQTYYMYSRNWNWGGGRMKEGREKRV